jgi:hypothetical protein
MRNVLNPPNPFGVQSELASQLTDIDFVNYMLGHQFPLTAQTVGALSKYIPVPPLLANVTPAQFYQSLSYYLGSYRQQNPGQFVG